MTQFNAFHIRYERGQRQLVVGAPGLVEHLEGFGGGLPTDAMWRSGGPLLIRAADKRVQILGWLRGLSSKDVGRENAWEAWGVLGLAGSFNNWVSFWDLLCAEPDAETLDGLVRSFGQNARGNAYPPLPLRLAEVLANEYANDTDKTRRIRVWTGSELTLLPWCCLLGPVPVSEATVGPPRRLEVHTSAPLTYDGWIVDAPLGDPGRVNASNSPVINEMVGHVMGGDIDSALNIADRLRRLPFAERRRQIYAPPVSTPDIAPQQKGRSDVASAPIQRTSPPPVKRSRQSVSLGRAWRRWTLRLLLPCIAGIALIQLRQCAAISRLADTVAELRPQAGAGPGTKTESASATDSTGTSASRTSAPNATGSAFDCNEWWMDSVERGQVLQALTKRLSEKSWQLGGKAGSLVTQHVWDASSEQIISDLAIQLQIDDAQCGQVGLDGDAGKGTQRAVESCARTGHTIQQDSAALHWLCGWVSAQSSVAARSAGN